MKTSKHLWAYLAQFVLELETCQANIVQKIKHILYWAIFFSENRTV
jgi:hypothetical protein